jgi:hypothetical protein
MNNSDKNFIPFKTFVVIGILFIVSLNFLAGTGRFHPDIPIGLVISNTLFLAIPLLIFFGILLIGLSFVNKKENLRKISSGTSRLIYLAPRIAGIVNILFLVSFILFVFLDDRNIWGGKTGFYIREIPQLVLGILMIPAWRWPLVGFITFGIAGVYYARMAFMTPIAMIPAFLMLSAPLFLISVLFFIDWKLRMVKEKQDCLLSKFAKLLIQAGRMMETKITKTIFWITLIVLAVLFIVTLILVEYELIISPVKSIGMKMTNLLLISIPLLLLYGSIGMILTAIRQKEENGKIKAGLSKFLYFTPRIVGILMIIFVSFLALDVFTEGGNFWKQLLAFITHNPPSMFLAILMVFAWRKPVIGFIIFGLIAVYFSRVVFDADFGPRNFILFVAPLALISGLFWINWKWKDEMMMRKAVGQGRKAKGFYDPS